MDRLAASEDALASVLAATLAGYRVVVEPGEAGDERALSIPPTAPRVVVGLAGLRASPAGEGQGGACAAWSIRIEQPDLRGSRARRRDEDAGAYPALAAIRGALEGLVLCVGHSPLLATGGELVRAGSPSLSWRETFHEHLPPGGIARPAVAAGLVLAGELSGAAVAGDTTLACEEPSLSDGDLAVIEAEDGLRMEFLGEVSGVTSNSFGVERAPSAGFVAGARLWRLPAPLAFPVAAASVRRVVADHGCVLGRTLGGEPTAALCAPPAWRIEFAFGPLGAEAAEVAQVRLLALARAGQVLSFGSDGGILAASIAGASAVARGRLEFSLDADPRTLSLDDWEVDA